MAIDFKTFDNIAPHIVAQRLPVLLRGRHGIGKSQVVYQFAAAQGLPVVERRASQMTEGDLLGLPNVSDDDATGLPVTTFNAPDWLHTASTQPVVLFLDEVDRATPEVRQGIFELTDSRKIAGRTLHPDTLIFAAVNGGEHGSQYQVGEMDPAELDRWVCFDVEPTIEDWLTWATSNIDTVIWDFINQNRDHLDHQGEFEPNKVYPSRRSWQRLNDVLTTASLLQANEASAALFPIAAGIVGFEAAVTFNDFVANYDRQLTVEDILVHGQISKTSDWGINDHCAMIEKFVGAEVFEAELDEGSTDNLARYFISLPSEAAMKLWTALGNGKMENTIALHKARVDDQSVSQYIVDILTGGDDAAK